MNRVFLPININDNHNKSTQELLHHIILNNSAISDKYKSLTIINNTINYNTNIKNFDNDLFKENLKDLNIKRKKNSKKNVLNINNDIDSEYSEITKSIATSQQKEQINNLKKEIDRLNQENKKQNDYINQINNLKNQLKEKDKEINDLKNKISKGNIKQYVDYNDIMVVHFNSGDGKIDHGIKCLPTETFAEVEEKLYKIYDEYRETNNIFLAKGNVIKRFKKMSENNIQNGDKIQLQNFNE